MKDPEIKIPVISLWVINLMICLTYTTFIFMNKSASSTFGDQLLFLFQYLLLGPFFPIQDSSMIDLILVGFAIFVGIIGYMYICWQMNKLFWILYLLPILPGVWIFLGLMRFGLYIT